MVRLLIQMKVAQLRHQRQAQSPWVGWVALVLGVTSALSTFLLGFVHYPSAAGGADVLALVFAVWIAARVSFGSSPGVMSLSGRSSSACFRCRRADSPWPCSWSGCWIPP